MGLRQIPRQFSQLRSRVQILSILSLAFIVRGVYWLIAPEANASDSAQFLQAAQGILTGEFTTFFIEFPLHKIYPILLLPAYIIPDGFTRYIPLLHISLSSLVVVFLFLINHEITQDYRAQILTALVAIFYPLLLFWMKFILTEAIFIPILTIYVYLTVRLMKRHNYKLALLWILVAALLILSRPVSLSVVILSAVALLAIWLQEKFPHQWKLFLGITLIVGIIFFIGLISISGIRNKIFRVPTVAQSLWLSTQVVKGTHEEYAAAASALENVDIGMGDLWDYKINFAIEFIQTQPLKYSWMAVERFFNYYYPWVYPQWSIKHRLLDAVLSLGLTITVIASFKAPSNKRVIVLLVSYALALGLTTAFTQIDTEARYRLPAEVLLLPAACSGGYYILEYLKEWQFK